MAPSTRSASSPVKRVLYDEEEHKDSYALEQSAPSTPRKKPRRKTKDAVVPVTPVPAPAIQSAGISVKSEEGRTGASQHDAGSSTEIDDSSQIIVRPKLSFDYQAAKAHLIRADPRFAEMFETLPCKPFEEETDLNPFRALCCSILGQQISWLAARSITHKFIRLVAFPELPEKLDPVVGLSASFPTPAQVLACPVTTLRAAGLSQRKAEYCQELAQRFVDGRLSAKALMEMSDEEVMKALVAVRGIGPWTVHMFQLFQLRRPDIMPPADLGVQKGLIRWLTMVNPSIHSRKKPSIPPTPKAEAEELLQGNSVSTPREATPPPSSSQDAPETPLPLSTPGPPSIPATSLNDPNVLDIPLMTPTTEARMEPTLPPFPESTTLTRQTLKARLTKKVKGNIYLTPVEMEELTEAWTLPLYRSLVSLESGRCRYLIWIDSMSSGPSA